MKLVYDMIGAALNGENRHPQAVMRSLGITYKEAVPQSLFDAWEFYDCGSIPSKLPEFIR